MTVHDYGAPHDPHVDVGAYALGVLDEYDMSLFEQHLALCMECGQQLDELSGLVPVLAELAQGGVPAPSPLGGNTDLMLRRLMNDVTKERRGRKRGRWLSLVAASVLIVGGPAAAVVATQDQEAKVEAAPVTVQKTSSNAATGMKATVGMVPKAWGTAVELQLWGIEGPMTCRLVAVSKDGERQVVSTWSVPKAGYGTEAEPKPLALGGATGLKQSGIERFDVVTAGGKRLMSVSL